MLCFGQSLQLIIIFIERTLCKRNSAVALIADSDQPLRESRDQEGQDGNRCGLSWSRSGKGARGRRARDSRLDDDGVIRLSPSYEFAQGFAADVMGPEVDVSINVFLAGVAPRRALLTTAHSIVAGRNSVLEELHCYAIDK